MTDVEEMSPTSVESAAPRPLGYKGDFKNPPYPRGNTIRMTVPARGLEPDTVNLAFAVVITEKTTIEHFEITVPKAVRGIMSKSQIGTDYLRFHA